MGCRFVWPSVMHLTRRKTIHVKNHPLNQNKSHFTNQTIYLRYSYIYTIILNIRINYFYISLCISPSSRIQDSLLKNKNNLGQITQLSQNVIKSPHRYSKIWRNIQLFKYTKISSQNCQKLWRIQI